MQIAPTVCLLRCGPTLQERVWKRSQQGWNGGKTVPNRCSLTSLVLWRMAGSGDTGKQTHLPTVWQSVTPLTWRHRLSSTPFIHLSCFPALNTKARKEREVLAGFLKPSPYVAMHEYRMLALGFQGIEYLWIGTTKRPKLTRPKRAERRR